MVMAKNENGKSNIMKLIYKILLRFQDCPLTNYTQNTRKGSEAVLFSAKTFSIFSELQSMYTKC